MFVALGAGGVLLLQNYGEDYGDHLRTQVNAGMDGRATSNKEFHLLKLPENARAAGQIQMAYEYSPHDSELSAEQKATLACGALVLQPNVQIGQNAKTVWNSALETDNSLFGDERDQAFAKAEATCQTEITRYLANPKITEFTVPLPQAR